MNKQEALEAILTDLREAGWEGKNASSDEVWRDMEDNIGELVHSIDRLQLMRNENLLRVAAGALYILIDDRTVVDRSVCPVPPVEVQPMRRTPLAEKYDDVPFPINGEIGRDVEDQRA